jgi:hypothetical protein
VDCNIKKEIKMVAGEGLESPPPAFTPRAQQLANICVALVYKQSSLRRDAYKKST